MRKICKIMGRKTEITLSAIIIILMLFALWLNSEYNEFSSKQLNDLNAKITQLIPKEPNIKISAVNEKNRSNTMEGGIYDCQLYNPSMDSNQTFPHYDIVRFFIRNDGKEVTKLKIDFDECMKKTKIFKICSELGQDTTFLRKDSPYKMIEIQGIGKVNPHIVTLIYVAGGSPIGCNVSYSSEEIIYNQTYVNFKE